MVAKFSIVEEVSVAESAFDRQERIDWWDQEKLFASRVMVVGAGAIGNEVIKNLCLLGVGYLFIVDYDTVSNSNLSRTVLFKRQDLGKPKAKIASERARELAVYENFQVDYFHGDLVWELGQGVYSQMDLVLGCLDNVEARMAMNQRVFETTRPWIDASIMALRARLSIYLPPDSSCYECSLTSNEYQMQKERYSCDGFKKQSVAESRIPTVQVTSSFIAALQVQESVKLICHDKIEQGTYVYSGDSNTLDWYQLRHNEECLFDHGQYMPDVQDIRASRDYKVSEFWSEVAKVQNIGDDFYIYLAIENWRFIESGTCRKCNNRVEVAKPDFRIKEGSLIICDCINEEDDAPSVDWEVLKKLHYNNHQYAEKTLADLGFSKAHYVQVVAESTGTRYAFHLSSDHADLLINHPNLQRND